MDFLLLDLFAQAPDAGTSSVLKFFALAALFFGGIFFLYALKYYMSIALILIANASRGNGYGNGRHKGNGNGNGNGNGLRGIPRNGDDHDAFHYKPFISVHLPLYNEKSVVDRLLQSVTSFDYENFEVIVADDSSDETSDILDQRWANHPRVKISRRHDRNGFKGGALQKALEVTDPRAEFIVVFDADFIPPPDILQQFLAYFFGVNGNGNGNGNGHNGEDEHPKLVDDRLAVVQGYQWHVLNASENWITRGIRTEFAGSYVIERSSQELLGSMKMISGSVFMIRADVLRQHGWGTSITEDWELTIRLYLGGYKVLYTPFIQAPSEIVATFKQLALQRMRWAEGHTFNVKKYFLRVITSPNLETIEKLEWIYYAPYYLQSVFFVLGTGFWLLSEIVFRYRLPMLAASIGWALVFTNALSLVFMNLAGLFMERGVRRNWRGLLSFILLTYLLVPYQAYASLKGLIEPHEGGWHRTQKTGVITDMVDKLGLGKRMKRLLPKQKKSKKKKKKGSGGIDIGRRLGGKSVAQVTRLIPAPVRKKLLGLSSGVRIAAGLAAVLLFLGLTAAVISGVEFAPNLAAGAIFIPIFAFLATERRRMAARLISVIVSLMLALALLSSQVGVVSAAPGSLYLYDTVKSGAAPAGETMDDSVGSSAASLTFDTAGQNAYWYTDLSYPTGGDDASIAAGDYLLEMYFNSLPSAVGWWDTAYGYKQQITVTAGSTSVPSGYSTLLTFDHAQLVTDGKALSSGDDLRVMFWNGGSFVELDRALDDGSSWDSATTDIWIQTQASIAASGTDTNYWIYYGNSGATGPPANKSNIFLFWDDFESETIGSVPSAWTEVTPTDDWSVQVDPTDGTNKLLRARNVSNNYVFTTSNLGAYNTELQARILSQSAGANDNPSVALSHRYNPGEPQSYRARQRTTGVGEFHIWKRSGNCTLASSAFTFPADTWVIQRARATDNGANVDLDFRTWEEATPATFAQMNATDVANACGIGEPVNQAYEKIGIYASESLEDLFFDDVRVRLYVSPEPTTPLSTEELLPSVDITVGVYHTKTDGTIPQLITSASTRIDPNTVDGLVINLGSGAAQTYTQADPQLLRVLVTVDAVNNGGSFDLAYGIAADPTNIETPSLTVLDPVLLLALFAILIPILT
ncbi:MAG: glycosyltransferase, partial [Anaerolineales bacterium]|nr:glycosyltransferase [Anaerolineales bacterium]